MIKKIYVFDPTIIDQQSRVRGIGRYLQIMKENFNNEFIFTDDKDIPFDSILINPFFNFLQPPYALKKITNKQIAIIHDLIPLKYPEHFPIGVKGKINLLLNKFCLKFYDLIITDSQAGKSDLINILKISPLKIKVITPTLPKLFWNNQPTTNNRQPTTDNYCLYVGDATWNKNLVNLARAIKLDNTNCIFVGKVFENKKNLNNSWQKELKTFFEEIDNDSRFIIKGFVNDQELIELYRKAKWNILISRDEGFGFSYLEALSQGCPSILADIPVFQEIAQQNAVFINQEEPKLIAEKIKTNINNNQPINLDKFSTTKFIQDWQKSIDSL